VDAPPGWVVAVGAASVSALGAWAFAALQAARRPRVLCLMYHRVAEREAWLRTRGTERVFTLPADAFEAQIQRLVGRGFSFVGTRDVAAFARGERDLPHRSVLLTIDDGCASAHREMLPILKRHGASAALFVTTDPASAIFRVGGATERRLTDDEIRELAAAGFDVGSHAVSHRPLSAMSDDEIRRELVDSKRELERVLAKPVVDFAVPANWFDERVLRIAREVGYATVFCSRPDTVRRGSGPLGIPRVNIEGQLDLRGFDRAISPAGVAQRRLVAAVRGWPKRALGPRRWTALRTTLLRGAAGRWLSPSRMATAAGVAVALGLVVTLLWLAGRG